MLISFVSCNKAIIDVPVEKEYPIGFKNAGIMESKASITNENIATEGNAFTVYGFYTLDSEEENGEVYTFNPNPVEVTYSDTEGWGYENTQYWITGGDYTFMAYFPADFPANISQDYPANLFTDFQIESQQSKQIDILACQVKRKTEDIFVENGNIVDFQFKHLLANIRVGLSMAAGYQATIKAVALTDVALTADCSYDYSSTPNIVWENHQNTTSVGDNKDNVILINKLDNPNEEGNDSQYIYTEDYFGGEGIMVIPEDISEKCVLLYIVTEITILNEDNTTMEKTFEIQLPANTVWEAGKRYTYDVELSLENNIKIGTPGVEQWNTGSFGGTIIIM